MLACLGDAITASHDVSGQAMTDEIKMINDPINERTKQIIPLRTQDVWKQVNKTRQLLIKGRI